MRCRRILAASVVFGGAFAASVAYAAAPGAAMVSAAPWQVTSSSGTALGAVVPTGLVLSGVSILPTAAPGLPETVAVNSEAGIRVELANGRNWTSFGDVAASPVALSSAYLSGATARASASFGLLPDLSLSVGHSLLNLGAFDATPPGTPTADLARRFGAGVQLIGTTSANLNWNFASWGGLALNASRVSGNGSLLESLTSAGVGSLGESTMLGISARVGFGEGWVTSLSYNESITQLDLNRAQLDAVRSQGYALGLVKRGVFGDDALGISVSQPAQVYGAANLTAINPGLALARQSDLAVGYVTTFLDGTIALQANAAYQVNAAGARGESAVSGVARAKLNF
jgi:hypothetical protein